METRELRHLLDSFNPVARLSTSDYFLFPKMKKCFSRKKVLALAMKLLLRRTLFEGLKQSQFLEGIQKIEIRWIDFIELRGDYIEK